MIEYEPLFIVDDTSKGGISQSGGIKVSKTVTSYWARYLEDLVLEIPLREEDDDVVSSSGESSFKKTFFSKKRMRRDANTTVVYVGDACCGKPFYLGTTLQFHLSDVYWTILRCSPKIDFTSNLTGAKFNSYKGKMIDRIRSFLLTAERRAKEATAVN